MVFQSVEHGVRNTANSNLQCRSVRNLLGDEASYLLLLIVRHCCRHLYQRIVNLYAGSDVVDVDKRIAVRERHLLVHLCDDNLGTFHSTHCKVGRNTIAAVSVLVRKRHVEQCHVERQITLAEERRHFAEEARYDLSFAAVYSLAHAVGNEEALRYEYVAQLCGGVWCVASANGKGRVHLHALQFTGACCDGIEEHLRNRSATLDIYTVVRLNQFCSLGG